MVSLWSLLSKALSVGWKYRDKLVILVLALVLVGVWRSRPGDPGYEQLPFPAPLIRTVEKVKVEIKEIPVPVYYPTPKEVSKIEKQIEGELPPGDLLGVHEFQLFDRKGFISITQPQPGAPLEVTVFPQAQKWFEWKLRDRQAILWTDVNRFDPDIELRQSLFRMGRVTTMIRIKEDDLLTKPNFSLQAGAALSF